VTEHDEHRQADEDDEHDGELVAAATAARGRAYAPYSDFTMGAAVRCSDGTLVPGALVENVSLGLAMCAERAALFATVARGLAPVALALVSKRTSGELTFPCGACLQVALELAGPDLTVTAADADDPGTTATRRLGDLIPGAPHRHTYAPT
jgi:cytidine deaminase